MSFEHENAVAPYQTRREQMLVFFLVAFGVLTLTYGVLFAVDFLPETPTAGKGATGQVLVATSSVLSDRADISVGNEATTTQEDGSVTTPVLTDVDSAAEHEGTAVSAALPTEIIFDTFDRTVPIQNPDSRAISDLNAALLSGAVRHPDSADFANEGTMFLFGHSSYLPHVVNKNYQAFNGIQKLRWGDMVRVRSSEREYVYRVDRVYQARASEAEVAIERGTSKLTLATCNSFGSKDDRYIVEASLVDSHLLSSRE